MRRGKITVLGAGIVGICCALELQQKGYQVTLVDRRGFGQETSHGNAGILSLSSVMPLASPELLGRLFRLATNQENDFLMHYSHLPWLLPWLTKFLLRCNRKTYINDGLAMSKLTLPSVEKHLEWIKQSNAGHLLNSVGALKLYRNPDTFDRNALERELFDQCGVKYSVIDKAECNDLEPDLHNIFEKGLLIEESQSLRDPQALSQCYAELFLSLGGEFKQAEVKQILSRSNQWDIISDQGKDTVEKLVVCMGAWTPALLKPLGYHNPIVIERGYHTVFQTPSNKGLTRPVFDVDGSFVMIPMNTGLRVTTGSNMVYRDTVETPIQIAKVTPRVREAFPVEQILLDEPWMGRRPSTPDSLPIIGLAPRHEDLWLAFGHSHMGLTLGPITGELIAELVSSKPHSIPPGPYSPSRYL
ncbi:MAG: D-amino-acid dehydrogenase [Polaribacter sp.]|jgi:D-amino-acid dehydrogenase